MRVAGAILAKGLKSINIEYQARRGSSATLARRGIAIHLRPATAPSTARGNRKGRHHEQE